MWVARVKLNGEKALIGSRCKKFGVKWTGYPISTYRLNNSLYLYFIGFVHGPEENKKEFVKDLKKEKRIVNVEENGGFVIGKLKEPVKHVPAYHYKFIHIEPAYIQECGTESWTLGSWVKKDLIDFADLVEETHEGELLSIKMEKINDFGILSVQPKITKKQREAIELAANNGYYDYPRKITLEKLAKLMNLSFSTYQAHLRKAEQKLLPFVLNRMNKEY